LKESPFVPAVPRYARHGSSATPFASELFDRFSLANGVTLDP